MGAVLARVGTVGLSSLPLLKVTTALTSSILTFGSLVEPWSCTPSDFAVCGKKISLFQNPAAAGWTTSKSLSAYCPVSC